MRKLERTLYLHSIPFSKKPTKNGRLKVLWAYDDEPIQSAERTCMELTRWLAKLQPPKVKTLYPVGNDWAFEAILAGGVEEVFLASPYICSPSQLVDFNGDSIYRMRQCIHRPACGGWRKYQGADKFFHEVRLYSDRADLRQRAIAAIPLFRRYMFLSPLMEPEGLLAFISLVGSKRWFAKSDCPTGATELKAYFGLRENLRYRNKTSSGNSQHRLNTLKACWGSKALEPLDDSSQEIDLLRSRVSIEGDVVNERPAIEFAIEYLAANWLHVLQERERLSWDLDFFVPDYCLRTEEAAAFDNVARRSGL